MKSSRCFSVLILVGIMLLAIIVPVSGSSAPSRFAFASLLREPKSTAVANASDGFALGPPATPNPVQSSTPTTTVKALANTPGWSPAGSMSTARFWHTATLLSSGIVLVVGGYGSSGDLTSAELYDPGSNTWSSGGNLGTARDCHTATLLPSGKVLVAGGLNGSSVMASAELYDPASNSWSPAGSMSTARRCHTATLLSSGKVLVTGGYGSSSVLTNAEQYDPGNNTWSSAGNMSTGRAVHTAALLPSGKVLVAGGGAELYDPGNNTWSSAGNMKATHGAAAATLLPSSKVLVTGGWSDGSAEVYDPGSNSWSPAGNMSTARADFTATLLTSGRVLAVGGWGNSGYGYSQASADLYDPGSNSWSLAESMIAARARFTATLLPSGKVLVAGGDDSGDHPIASAELYDPGTYSFSCGEVTEIPQTECEALVALYNSTNGPGWINNQGWLANNHPCTGEAWYGLWEGCSEVRLRGFGHIRNIWLSDNHLSGPIPPEIGNLGSLVDLELSSNQLTGSIPPELGRLSSLEWLELESNSLSGPLPRSLMSLSSLYVFRFDSTGLCEPGDAQFQAWLAGIPNLMGTGVICPVPGGTWISPDDNFGITGNSLHFAAHAYDYQGGSGVAYVNFTAWWQGVDPKVWYTPCKVSSPTSGTTDVYECNWNLTDASGQPVPNGPITVSFDVYDKAGYYNLAPNGTRHGTFATVSPVDIGFRPTPDGYSFANYGGQFSLPPYDFTTDDVVNMFGPDAACAIRVGLSCDLKPQAYLWWYNVNYIMNKGHCDGMASTSLRFFKKLETPAAFQDGAQWAYDLRLDSIRHHIAFYFAEQTTDPIMKYRYQSEQSTPNAILIALSSAMQNGASDPRVLSFWRSPEGPAHSITPYAIQDKGGGVYWVKVYDNRHPYSWWNPGDSDRQVVFDTISDTWSYDMGGATWSGDASTHTLALTPMSLYSSLPVCPWCNNTNGGSAAAQVGQVWLAGAGHLLIANSQGQRLGYAGNQLVSEIPGAYAAPIAAGLGSQIEPIYTLPLTNTYTILLDGQVLTRTETVAVTQFGLGYAVAAGGLSLSPNEQDRLAIGSNGTHIAYQSATTKPVTLTLDLDDANASRQLQVGSAHIGAGQVVTLTANTSSGQLVFNNSRASGGPYELDILKVDATGEHIFIHRGISMLPTDTHYADYGMWDGSGPITLEIDHGSKGTVDETVVLVNQAGKLYLPLVRKGG
jgi:N-acetylneuraminic acid mutarotase